MRLPSSCAVIAGTVSLPRSPALLDAGQFFSAHVLSHAVFFESSLKKNLNRQQFSKTSNGHLFLFFLKVN